MKFDMPSPDAAMDKNGAFTREWVKFLGNLLNDAIWRGRSGTTADRPTDGREVGTPYFDTTLDAPIWWDGTAWVRAAAGKIGLFTHLLSVNGAQAVTGLGFKPRFVLFVAGISSGTFGGSVGITDGTNMYILQITTGAFYLNSGFCIYIAPAGTADYQLATIASFDADGFTVTWTTGGAPGAVTGSVWYFAL